MISEELAQLKQDIKQTQADIRRFERDLAWNRVIDKAIIVCRLLRKLDMAEAHKFNPNWAIQPRVPKEQVGGGRWTRPGGGRRSRQFASDRRSRTRIWWPTAPARTSGSLSLASGQR